jgi:hypothetical protein
MSERFGLQALEHDSLVGVVYGRLPDARLMIHDHID